MAKILINTTEVVNSGSKAGIAKNITGSVAGRIDAVKNATDSQILGRGGLGGRLDAVYRKVSQLEQKIAEIQSTANNGAMQYQRTEASLDGLAKAIVGVSKKTASVSETRSALEKMFAPDIKYVDIGEEIIKFLSQNKSGLTEEQKNFLQNLIQKIEDAAKKETKGITKEKYEKETDESWAVIDKQFDDVRLQILGVEYEEELKKIFGEASLTAFLGKISTANTDHYFRKIEGKVEDEMTSSLNFEDIGPIGDAIDNKLEDIQDRFGIPHDKDEEEVYIKDGKEISKEEAGNFYEREAALAEINSTASVSASLYDGEFRLGDEGKITATVCEAEAHASVSAGMYVIAADGTRRFSPGVKAEIGASVTAFEAEWEQQWLGDEMLGLNTDVTATVGRAEAQMEAVAQIWGENGDLDVQVNAGVSAELIGGEIEGSAAVNVLGGEIGIKGSVNYGIGVHADIGYKDGVIKCDIGASLGLGVSVGLELDVGGMVDTVADMASSAWDEITDGWNSITSGIFGLFK